MEWDQWGVLAVGVLVLAGGGWFVYDTQIACDDCDHSDYANDLALENQRSVPVDVAVTVRENGTVVATANETVPAEDRTDLPDLVPYGTYDLSVRQGNETLRTEWRAQDCYYNAVVVTSEGLDQVTEAC